MKTASLMAVAIAFAMLSPLTLLGCNKKEDDAPPPAPTAAAVAPPTTAATPPAAIPPPLAPPPVTAAHPAVGVTPHPGVHVDGGTRGTGPQVAAVAFDASVLALPGLPTLQPSAIPAIASGIVGGIIGALPSGFIPPPPAPAK